MKKQQAFCESAETQVRHNHHGMMSAHFKSDHIWIKLKLTLSGPYKSVFIFTQLPQFVEPQLFFLLFFSLHCVLHQSARSNVFIYLLLLLLIFLILSPHRLLFNTVATVVVQCCSVQFILNYLHLHLHLVIGRRFYSKRLKCEEHANNKI